MTTAVQNGLVLNSTSSQPGSRFRLSLFLSQRTLYSIPLRLPSPIANVHCVGIYPTDNERPSTLRAPPLSSYPHPIFPSPTLHFASVQADLILSHSCGCSILLVPGCEEPNFLSAKSESFENHGMNVNSKR